MANNGLCSYCLYVNTYTRATLVDHYIPVRDAYERRYDATNLISSCSACNTRKAIDEDKLRNNQITVEEFKSRWRYERE
ncbi:HNH endonuclease [Staphylococcus arlettae]|uniref:HNH endonuclease n=1 Tax=Staphylococcus arlettae TaxID=29378 RepID=UPI0039F1DE6F